MSRSLLIITVPLVAAAAAAIWTFGSAPPDEIAPPALGGSETVPPSVAPSLTSTLAVADPTPLAPPAAQAESSEPAPAQNEPAAQMDTSGWYAALDPLGSRGLEPRARGWDARLRYTRVDLDHVDSPAEVVFVEIGRATGVPILFDPSVTTTVQRARTSLRLRGITAYDALQILQQQVGLAMLLDAQGLHIVPNSSARGSGFYTQPIARDVEWTRDQERRACEEIQRRLAKAILCNFQDTPFDEAIDFFRDIVQINLVTTSDAQRATWKDVTLRNREARPASEFLEEITKARGLEVALRRGVALIRTQAEGQEEASGREEIDREVRAGQEAVLERTVGALLAGGTVVDAAALIEAKTGIAVSLDEPARAADGRISFPPDQTIESICERVTVACEVTWSLERSHDRSVYRLAWSAGHSGLEPLLREVLVEAAPWASDPRVSPWLTRVESDLVDLVTLRERAADPTIDLGRLRETAREIRAAKAAALGSGARTLGLVDLLVTETGVTPSAMRVERWARLSTWLRETRTHDRKAYPACEQPAPPPEACHHSGSVWAREIALWLARQPGTPHPAGPLLR